MECHASRKLAAGLSVNLLVSLINGLDGSENCSIFISCQIFISKQTNIDI